MLKAPRVKSILASLAIAGTCICAAAAAEPPKDGELLRDFVHYTRIARYDLASANGQALLDRLEAPFGKAEAGKGMKLADFVKLVEASGELARFEETAVRGQRIGELESVASRLLKAYEAGKLEQARSAAEISRNISMLTGTMRQRAVARERLIGAGEYAAVQLLEALQKKSDPALQAEARQVLVDMRQQALAPLLAALGGLPPETQETVVGILAAIPYKSSLPYLYDLRASSKNAGVRAAAEKAIVQLDGAYNPGVTAASLYEALGEAYYAGLESLTSFPRESMQLLWSYNPSSGLVATNIDTRVFNEAMAMRMAEKALSLDAAANRSLSLWLAANFSREIDQPKDYSNPAYGPDRRDAMYYAVAAGPSSAQAVLGRALDRRDTPLARRAIAAIERTAGATALTGGDSARRPLLEALRYPNRRVQYEAALALAVSQPGSSFEGAERVVPILGSAIRDAGAKYAVVIAASDSARAGQERQASLADWLRGMGYTVLAPGASLADVEAAVAEAPGVDLLVTDLPSGATARTLEEARQRTKLGVTPILAIVSMQGEIDLAGSRRDDMTRLLRAGADPKQMTEAVEQLVLKASGGAVSAEEAADYQARALAALRDLAVSGNAVLQVADGSAAMIAAMAQAKGPVKMKIADVLSYVGDKKAQVALMDAALAAQGDEMVDLLRITTQSAKRHGNMLEDRQVRRLLGMTRQGNDAQATAVAALIGALSLPNQDLIPLILGK